MGNPRARECGPQSAYMPPEKIVERDSEPDLNRREEERDLCASTACVSSFWSLLLFLSWPKVDCNVNVSTWRAVIVFRSRSVAFWKCPSRVWSTHIAYCPSGPIRSRRWCMGRRGPHARMPCCVDDWCPLQTAWGPSKLASPSHCRGQIRLGSQPSLSLKRKRVYPHSFEGEEYAPLVEWRVRNTLPSTRARLGRASLPTGPGMPCLLGIVGQRTCHT